ncbi:hypothetical protein AVEN_29952-1 [Araneus ventricosus]|uniref:Uncharacterized protein n=1 Tax=Araneus ventricosus TaxID=182803 RepID=A0A4Y2IC10_ARAVE|nr:hypothetical protein AVEN_29952-1 [Araneus ventricosus]
MFHDFGSPEDEDIDQDQQKNGVRERIRKISMLSLQVGQLSSKKKRPQRVPSRWDSQGRRRRGHKHWPLEAGMPTLIDDLILSW